MDATPDDDDDWDIGMEFITQQITVANQRYAEIISLARRIARTPKLLDRLTITVTYGETRTDSYNVSVRSTPIVRFTPIFQATLRGFPPHWQSITLDGRNRVSPFQSLIAFAYTRIDAAALLLSNLAAPAIAHFADQVSHESGRSDPTDKVMLRVFGLAAALRYSNERGIRLTKAELRDRSTNALTAVERLLTPELMRVLELAVENGNRVQYSPIQRTSLSEIRSNLEGLRDELRKIKAEVTSSGRLRKQTVIDEVALQVRRYAIIWVMVMDRPASPGSRQFRRACELLLGDRLDGSVEWMIRNAIGTRGIRPDDVRIPPPPLN